MTQSVIINASGDKPFYDYASIAAKVNELLTSVSSEMYATINPHEDEEITYPYGVYDFDVEAVGDDQRAEGYYLDLELFDRNGSYADLYTLESAVRNLLDKARILDAENWYMIKWNRTQKIPTEQRGLIRLGVQYYIKVETRKRVY